MKIVVIGGSGLIGSMVVASLGADGHEAVAASPNTGVNTLTGDGLADVLHGAEIVVDVSNSPSFEDAAVLEFFSTSTGNLLAAEERAGVGHHVALSVVGTSRLPESGYMRAKVQQEQLIEKSPLPFSLVHATQFYEFFSAIAAGATVDGEVRLTTAIVRPMAAEDVARVIGRTAVAAPRNGALEIGGPEELGLNEFVARGLAAHHDDRRVIADDTARYFGAHLTGRELVPGNGAELASLTFAQWLANDVASGSQR